MRRTNQQILEAYEAHKKKCRDKYYENRGDILKIRKEKYALKVVDHKYVNHSKYNPYKLENTNSLSIIECEKIESAEEAEIEGYPRKAVKDAVRDAQPEKIRIKKRANLIHDGTKFRRMSNDEIQMVIDNPSLYIENP